MTFNKCSIRGKLYGYVIDEAGNEVQDPEVIFYLKYLFIKKFFLLINILEIKSN